jgi:C4-type Zn-finger protein
MGLWKKFKELSAEPHRDCPKCDGVKTMVNGPWEGEYVGYMWYDSKCSKCSYTERIFGMAKQ